MVAFIIGGNGRNPVEAYSPDGRCSRDLGLVWAVTNVAPVMGLINGKITACSMWFDTTSCAVYNTTANYWSSFPSMRFSHLHARGSLKSRKKSHVIEIL
jgi:hypothetical protein